MNKTLYEVLGVVLALCLVVGGAYFAGHHNEGTAAKLTATQLEVKQADADTHELQRQQVQTESNAAKSAVVSDKRDDAVHQSNIQYRTITRTVTQYVQTHPDSDSVVLDDDGLRIWRAANSGSIEPVDADHAADVDAAQVHDAAAATGERQAVDAAVESHRSDAAVSPVRDRPQRVD